MPCEENLDHQPDVSAALAFLAYLHDIDVLLEDRERRAFGDAALARQRRLLRELREYLEARVDLAALQREQPPAPLPLEAVGLFCMVEDDR